MKLKRPVRIGVSTTQRMLEDLDYLKDQCDTKNVSELVRQALRFYRMKLTIDAITGRDSRSESN